MDHQNTWTTNFSHNCILTLTYDSSVLIKIVIRFIYFFNKKAFDLRIEFGTLYLN